MKKMMAATLICCLLPLLPARAEGIKAQVNAPARIEAYYTSKTGKSEVIVDASVIVPDVPLMYQTKVSARSFTAADAWRLARAALPEAAWVRFEAEGGIDAKIPYTGDPEALERLVNDVAQGNEMSRASLYFLIDQSSDLYVGMYDRNHEPDLPPQCNVTAFQWDFVSSLGRFNKFRRLSFDFSGHYNHPYYDLYNLSRIEALDGSAIRGQPLSLEEARDLAQSLVSKVNGDFTLYSQGAVSGEITYHKTGTKQYRNTNANSKAYGFAFTRVVEGVPITLADTQMASSTETKDFAAAPAPGYETLFVLVDGKYIISYTWEFAYELGERTPIEEKLLPFPQIMDIFGAISPLTIASMEGDSVAMSAGHNRLNIYEIRLGYMPVRLKNDPNTWILRPIWDFFGTRSFAREKYDWLGDSRLTIDALDGTIIDRQFGY